MQREGNRNYSVQPNLHLNRLYDRLYVLCNQNPGS